MGEFSQGYDFIKLYRLSVILTEEVRTVPTYLTLTSIGFQYLLRTCTTSSYHSLDIHVQFNAQRVLGLQVILVKINKLNLINTGN